ncbi:hypothetical protein G7K_6496-t1 [Saitoella complicata NRRL Y-17804]|uniref:Uncharacterized protein n=1 Tax=Saitoella complicata (strain BCRC 22490 / CBS 7301 / JCM 7358 / NBRC 10748 / NRRL Y-17804) TaxID=698492 RepID=A0A0E9NRL2_SAICN|nr:hypothetical protein G7K_6496-t1 [Saitoella complicata NRRL Y-17804]
MCYVILSNLMDDSRVGRSAPDNRKKEKHLLIVATHIDEKNLHSSPNQTKPSECRHLPSSSCPYGSINSIEGQVLALIKRESNHVVIRSFTAGNKSHNPPYIPPSKRSEGSPIAVTTVHEVFRKTTEKDATIQNHRQRRCTIDKISGLSRDDDGHVRHIDRVFNDYIIIQFEHRERTGKHVFLVPVIIDASEVYFPNACIALLYLQCAHIHFFVPFSLSSRTTSRNSHTIQRSRRPKRRIIVIPFSFNISSRFITMTRAPLLLLLLHVLGTSLLNGEVVTTAVSTVTAPASTLTVTSTLGDIGAVSTTAIPKGHLRVEVASSAVSAHSPSTTTISSSIPSSLSSSSSSASASEEEATTSKNSTATVYVPKEAIAITIQTANADVGANAYGGAAAAAAGARKHNDEGAGKFLVLTGVVGVVVGVGMGYSSCPSIDSKLQTIITKNQTSATSPTTMEFPTEPVARGVEIPQKKENELSVEQIQEMTDNASKHIKEGEAKGKGTEIQPPKDFRPGMSDDL